MELRDLRCFISVYDQQSFSRAAAMLNTTQSNVSARIRRLEQEFGGPLFERLHRRIEPTPKGDQAYSYAKKVIEVADSGAEAIRKGEAA